MIRCLKQTHGMSHFNRMRYFGSVRPVSLALPNLTQYQIYKGCVIAITKKGGSVTHFCAAGRSISSCCFFTDECQTQIQRTGYVLHLKFCTATGVCVLLYIMLFLFFVSSNSNSRYSKSSQSVVLYSSVFTLLHYFQIKLVQSITILRKSNDSHSVDILIVIQTVQF